MPELPYLKAEKHYLFAQFPHGVYPMNAWLAMTFAGTGADGCWPAASELHVPHVLKHLLKSVLMTANHVS